MGFCRLYIVHFEQQAKHELLEVHRSRKIEKTRMRLVACQCRVGMYPEALVFVQEMDRELLIFEGHLHRVPAQVVLAPTLLLVVVVLEVVAYVQPAVAHERLQVAYLLGAALWIALN